MAIFYIFFRLYKCKAKPPRLSYHRGIREKTFFQFKNTHTTLSHTSHTARNVKKFHSEESFKRLFFLFKIVFWSFCYIIYVYPH